MANLAASLSYCFLCLARCSYGYKCERQLHSSGKGATLSEQGIFSLASWPFSFKVLWAPLVDTYYVRSMGQRRSWILPLQVTVGLTLLFTARNLDWLIYHREADIRALSAIFFLIYFLLASQDIAVMVGHYLCYLGKMLAWLLHATLSGRPLDFSSLSLDTLS